MRNTIFVLGLGFISIPALALLSDNVQKPLHGSPADSDTVHALTLSSHLHYTLQTNRDALLHNPPLHALQDPNFYITARVASAIITIPANAASDGHIRLSTSRTYTQPPDDHALNHANDDKLVWLAMHERTAVIPLQGMGVRKGGMISMPVRSARLDLGTPFLWLPAQMWDVLVLATRPEGTAAWVQCARRELFPDVVFENADEDEEGEGEVVITPWQYVLEVEGEGCMLLAKKMQDTGLGHTDDVVLGWSAVRGRRVVVDSGGRRMGFSR